MARQGKQGTQSGKAGESKSLKNKIKRLGKNIKEGIIAISWAGHTIEDPKQEKY